MDNVHHIIRLIKKLLLQNTENNKILTKHWADASDH
jgi:hypothetical protein